MPPVAHVDPRRMALVAAIGYALQCRTAVILLERTVNAAGLNRDPELARVMETSRDTIEQCWLVLSRLGDIN